MKIVFEGTLNEISFQVGEFYGALVHGQTREAVDPEPEPEKPKRKRRTKEQMEADRAAAIAGAGSGETDPRAEAHADGADNELDEIPPLRRRRVRENENAAEEAAEGNLKRGRKRREGAADPTPAPHPARLGEALQNTSTTKSPSDDDISDADVAKAASEGAQELTPTVVTAILEEFGVSVVNDLSQEQRREFVDQIATEIANIEELKETKAPAPKRRRRKK